LYLMVNLIWKFMFVIYVKRESKNLINLEFFSNLLFMTKKLKNLNLQQ
jgi:hypothetical protein